MREFYLYDDADHNVKVGSASLRVVFGFAFMSSERTITRGARQLGTPAIFRYFGKAKGDLVLLRFRQVGTSRRGVCILRKEVSIDRLVGRATYFDDDQAKFVVGEMYLKRAR